jgi:hypothetical protein
MTKIYPTRTLNGNKQVRGIEGNWLGVKGYAESLEAYPGDGRRYLSQDGEPGLANTCYIPSKCGCEVVGCGTLQFPLTVQHCEKHA